MIYDWRNVSLKTHGMLAINKALYRTNPKELSSEGKVCFPPMDNMEILKILWRLLPGVVLMNDVPNDILLTMAALTRDSCDAPDDSLLKSMLDRIKEAGSDGVMLNHVNGKEMSWRITLKTDGCMVMEDSYFNQQVLRSRFIYDEHDQNGLVLYGTKDEEKQAMCVIATKLWVLHNMGQSDA